MQYGAGIDYDNYHQRDVTLTASRIIAASIFFSINTQLFPRHL